MSTPDQRPAPTSAEKILSMLTTGVAVSNNVEHPAHYNQHPSGIEAIEVVRHYSFNIGSAIKYLWRAGLKADVTIEDGNAEIQDMEKAVWYIQDEIKKRRAEIEKLGA